MLKKIIGALLFLCGAVAFGVSMYINQQIAEGKIQVESAQKKINEGKGLFNAVPGLKQFGQGPINSAEKKIGEANEQIAYYEDLSSQLRIAGIVLVIVGIGVFFIGGSKKKN